MKCFKTLIILFFLTSCTQSDDSLHQTSKSNLDIDEIQESTTPFHEVTDDNALRLSMSQFTNNLKPFYESGMSYNDFKFSLDPRNGLSNIKPAGDNLLNEAYNYIVNDTHESNMDGNLILLSFTNAFENNDTLLDRKGFDEVDDNDYDLIFRDLFGLTSSYEVPNLNKGGCEWYRIDCHVGWLINTIANWWNTPAPGEGGMTNGQVLQGFAAVLGGGGAIGIVLILLL